MHKGVTMKNINIRVKALPEDKVIVVNYKSRYKPWENGTVRSVKAGIRKDGTYRISYEVLLDRRSSITNRAPNGNPLFLYVGDDAIRLTDEKTN